MNKYITAFFSFLGTLFGRCSGTIRKGCWTIRHPARYTFDKRLMGGYQFMPTLTVGSNGVMLSVQIVATNLSSAQLEGKDFAARVESAQGTLRQLHALGEGALMEILGMPFAIWYFAPPAAGESIRKIVLSKNKDALSWNFADGKKI